MSAAAPIAPSPSRSPPVNPWLSHTAFIDEITPEIPGVFTYHLALRDPEAAAVYRFQPGQFNMLYLPGVGEIAISLSANPRSQGRWTHTIRVTGTVTGALSRMKRGDTLGLRGPFGAAWPMTACDGLHVVLVAGGIGLAPLRPAIYELLERPDRYASLTLFCGARSPDTLLYTQEYGDWTSRGMTVQSTVDRATTAWNGNVGVVPLLIDRLPLADPRKTVVLTCGPEVMMNYSVRSARARGIPRENIWLSAERNMQCAVGLCGHCQWGPEFVCKDGPVFRYDRIAPYLTVEAL